MVLDCSDLGLDYIPSGYKNVRVLDMSRNKISSVSEGTLLGLYPNLDLIDLWILLMHLHLASYFAFCIALRPV
jgi:Leucine-rich repeat (LRR) protein